MSDKIYEPFNDEYIRQVTEMTLEQAKIAKSIRRAIMFNIKGLLKRRGITQEKMAEMLGLRRGALSDMLNCRTLPKPEYIIMMAKILDVAVDDLSNPKYLKNNKSHGWIKL